jgi:hypothetical protein
LKDQQWSIRGLCVPDIDVIVIGQTDEQFIIVAEI